MSVTIPDEILESLAVELDEGEAETIALGKQIGGDFVLMDERRGRRAARRTSTVMWTCWSSAVSRVSGEG
jgi:predicted nucleic acid-binding protein